MSVAAPPPERPIAPGPPPTFSVVVAAYQAAATIGEALDSALEQTVPPHEIVVCDDGSTDDLDAALAPFRERIVLVRQENGGEASAKNAAARAATGEFVAILDADDVYLPGRLEALAALASARPDLDLLTTDAYLEVDGRVLRRVYGDDWTFEVDDQRREIMRRNFVFGHAAVRRDRLLAAGGFDERIRFTTDWECWMRLILGGSRAGAVLQPLARYRVRRTSLSADRTQMTEGRVQSLRTGLEHPALRAEERETALATLATLERDLAVLRLHDAVRSGGTGTRRLALAITFGRGTALATRLKALAAVVAPGLAGRLVRRRDRRVWLGAGETTVEHV